MKRKLFRIMAATAMVTSMLAGCGGGTSTATQAAATEAATTAAVTEAATTAAATEAAKAEAAAGDDLIVVGYAQVGAESDWRTANTESFKSTFTEANGYKLIFDDAQ